MKKLFTILGLLMAAPASAQVATTPGTAPAQTPAKVETAGSATIGAQQLTNDSNSAKFTEYRDIRDDVYIPSLAFGLRNLGSGWFLAVGGVNVSRNDQTVTAQFGRTNVWDVQASWAGTPHNYSNKAVTPYIERSPGVFGVPATIPITFKKLATTPADTVGVLASDELIANYQKTYLAPTALATQTNAGHFGLSWHGSDALSVGLAYDVRDKSGSKSTFGPIGDRPPRTLNIQLPEPVDYRTNELSLATEHAGSGYLLRAEYLFSDFANQIDTLQWQNVYATPAAPGATYDVWDRSVSVYGVRPLASDNRYQNVSLAAGVDLPAQSRLNATAAYGLLEQNATLLPYSYNVDQLANKTLPRSTADARMHTLNFTADYVLAPADRVNVRAFYRYYSLDNLTPSSQWQYVTSDTSNLNGTVAYVNKRVNLPYAWGRQNAGAEATWRLFKRSSLLLGYEREDRSHVHREADTGENILRATWRTRAVKWMTFEARYLYGNRRGDGYHNQVTQEGYWYTAADNPDNNNPKLTFDNHPDMRRFDVSDRLRHQFDMRVSVTPRDGLSLSAYARYRNDDFDSNVTPSQPLLGTGLAEASAASPGNQLGWLKDKRFRSGFDVFVQPSARLTFNAFVSYDKGTSAERSLEFNENNKANPSAVATAELGPWTRASSQWNADFGDRTWSAGAGASWHAIADRLTLSADYSASLGRLAIGYTGYGLTNFDGTPFPPNHQFYFSSPTDVTEDLHTVNLRVEVPIKMLTVVAGYLFESYTLDDWQQGSQAPWVEAVGADTLLRDTSRSYQWGNRLFNFGTYLSPSYRAQMGFVGLRYRF